MNEHACRTMGLYAYRRAGAWLSVRACIDEVGTNDGWYLLLSLTYPEEQREIRTTSFKALGLAIEELRDAQDAATALLFRMADRNDQKKRENHGH